MVMIRKNSLIILRQLCSVAGEHAKALQAAPVVRKVKTMMGQKTTATVRINGGDISDVFWKKYPKTGNWMPENHFGDIDVADLRKELLSKTVKI